MDAAKTFELLIKQLSLTFALRNYLKQGVPTVVELNIAEIYFSVSFTCFLVKKRVFSLNNRKNISCLIVE